MKDILDIIFVLASGSLLLVLFLRVAELRIENKFLHLDIKYTREMFRDHIKIFHTCDCPACQAACDEDDSGEYDFKVETEGKKDE